MVQDATVAALADLEPSRCITRAKRTNGKRISWPIASAPLLEAITEPAFLLNAARRLLGCNSTARALLAAEQGLAYVAGELRSTSACGTDRLTEALAAVGGKGGTGLLSQQVILPKTSGASRFGLLLVRWVQPNEHGYAGGPMVLAIAHAVVPDMPDNALRFGLTAAEAKVAEDLIAGWSPKQIAERQGRSLHTVRSHLARLMSKTQTGRQADLLRKLMQPDSVTFDQAA